MNLSIAAAEALDLLAEPAQGAVDQRLDGLGVHALGGGRVAGEVGEQRPSPGGAPRAAPRRASAAACSGARGGRRRRRELGAALHAELGAGGILGAAAGAAGGSAAPQDMQKRARSGFSAAQEGQLLAAAICLNDTGLALRWRSPSPASQERNLATLTSTPRLPFSLLASRDRGARDRRLRRRQRRRRGPAAGPGGDLQQRAEGRERRLRRQPRRHRRGRRRRRRPSRPASAGPSRAAATGPFPSFDIDARGRPGQRRRRTSPAAPASPRPATRPSSTSRTPTTRCPPELFSQFAASFHAGPGSRASRRRTAATSSSSLGIDPTNWLTDLANEGNEDVEGTETIHISGTADVPKLVEDIKQIAETAPQAAGQVTPEQTRASSTSSPASSRAPTSTSTPAPTTTSCASSRRTSS